MRRFRFQTLLSRESDEQPKFYKFASSVCKTSHGQRTGMIQVGGHRAQLVESMSTISMMLFKMSFR